MQIIDIIVAFNCLAYSDAFFLSSLFHINQQHAHYHYHNTEASYNYPQNSNVDIMNN